MPPSSLHRRAPAWFGQVDFVLVGTSHPGNVGAAARALRAMGLRHLVLAAPRDPQVCRHPQALARASRADDVLARARLAPDLATALAGHTLAIAVSAETREFGPPPQPPEKIAALACAHARAGAAHRVALVFGPERTGLTIEQVGLCQAVCSIPGDETYQSLNLAQAVQVLAYCLGAEARREAAEAAPGGQAAQPGDGALCERPASQAQIEAMYEHLERALVLVGFLDPRRPRKLMPRLRRLFARTRLEEGEVAILRGICSRIERHGRS